MKKKLAILLAGIMVASMIPMTAFAKTSNYMTKTVTLKKDTYTNYNSAPELVLKEDTSKDISTTLSNADAGEEIVFELNLNNAEWGINGATEDDFISELEYAIEENFSKEEGIVSCTVLKSTSKSITVKLIKGDSGKIAVDLIKIPVFAKATETGDATITVNALSAPVTSGTYTFATVSTGATSTTIEKKVSISEASSAIKPISIVEIVPGTLTPGKEITLKLSNRFEFVNPGDAEITLAYGDLAGGGDLGMSGDFGYDNSYDPIKREFVFYIPDGPKSTTVSKIVISGLQIKAKSSAVDGDIADITISGADMTKQTLEVATYYDYGYKFEVEDKEVPVLYTGSRGEDNETLKVIFEEVVEDSWVASRKTTFAFNEGVKIESVEYKKVSNVTSADGKAADLPEDAWYDNSTANGSISENELTLNNLKVADGEKAKIEMVFNLNISPEYVGDVTLTCGGSAVSKDITVVPAVVEMPIIVEAELNELNIDYRNVATSDITITEAYAGALEQGKTLGIMVDEMNIERGYTWEVTGGDLEIENVRVNGGVITFEIKSESAKEPGTIKFSNLELYLQRGLPAGNYPLMIVYTGNEYYDEYYNDFRFNGGDAFFESYGLADCLFDTKEVVAIDSYVKVITAGRDSDDSTFTTKIVVPVGAYEITAGSKTIAIDVPAYISEDGYTMMPLRGVVEALSNTAIVSWDGTSRTVTILFGARVISMTIGVKAMVINGTTVAMSQAPVIEGDRTFLPLRDLGYALGLSEEKIAWDDATKTATLN